MLRLREIETLADSKKHPYVHVVDGGVSDNLGLLGMLEFFEQIEASPRFRDVSAFDPLRHVVVISVNARTAPKTDWTRSPSPPGFLDQLLQSSSVPIDHYSAESVELLKDIAERWGQQRRLKVAELQLGGMSKAAAKAEVPALTFDAIDISLDAVADPVERRYFMELPTSFSLPAEAVNRLRALGGRLLRESKAALALVQKIPASGAAAATPARPQHP